MIMSIRHLYKLMGVVRAEEKRMYYQITINVIH